MLQLVAMPENDFRIDGFIVFTKFVRLQAIN